MAHVLLLRAATSDEPDRYESALRDQGLKPVSVSVVETGYTNLDHLKDIVVAGPDKVGYGGVIMTSARSCEAWKAVVVQLIEEDALEEAEDATRWADIPFYVVGEATARALLAIRDIDGRCADYAPTAAHVRGAGTTGTSEKLAHSIVDDLAGAPRDSARTQLLYLTGDKNRDTLPRILADAGVRAVPLQVYETHGSETFAADLAAAVRGASEKRVGGVMDRVRHPLCLPAHASLRWWIVYFAPSEAEFCTPILQEHFALSGPGAAQAGERPRARIASIGPTTGDFLRDKLGLQVDVVAPKPNAASLAEAIAQFDAAHPWQ